MLKPLKKQRRLKLRAVVKRMLLASGMSADEILEKLK